MRVASTPGCRSATVSARYPRVGFGGRAEVILRGNLQRLRGNLEHRTA